MDDTDLEQLEHKVEQLITHCEHLAQENIVLREQHRVLEQEQFQLREKNNLVSKKVAKMLSRLQSIESEQ